MADEQPTLASGGRRRIRGAEAMARSHALERLKALRSGGRRSENGGAFQIKMEKPVYDTVPEDEYDTLVAKRREEVKGFIVDDDGLGYGDEGEEEDWSVTGLPPSSDESGGENERPKNRKKVEKKDPPVKKPPPSSLSAASIGNQRLSSMFTSSVFKKSYKDDKGKGSCADSIVDDVIAEFAPDDVDRLKRRRGTQSVAVRNGTVTLKSVKTECLSDGFCDLMTGSAKSNSEDVVMNFGAESNGVVDDCKLSEESKRKDVMRECKDGKVLGSEIENGDGISKVVQNVVEAKVEEVSQKKEEVFILNAIIKEEKDPSKSASAGWKEVMSGSRTNGATTKVDDNLASEITNADFDFDADGSLPFYVIDAHEEQYGANRGIVYLFGKVKTGNTYQSCCVIVKNMQRCVYAVPSHCSSYPDEAIKLEKELEESHISSTDFRKRLQDLASGLKNEIAKQLLNLNVSTYSMAPVKRKYAFERSEIPAGENYVLKITYPFKDQPLPTDLKGENFCALLGTHCSALELLLIKRKIRGPSWISISRFGICSPSERVSWCKFEVTVDSPKDIRNSTSSKITAEIPPVVVAAINLKTILNGKQNVHEIVSASIVCCQRAKIDTPMLAAEWKQPGILSHFTVVRKLDGGIFPMGFSKEVVERNKRAGSPVLREESSERALLNRLMVELHKLDSDILVGHKISSFDLEVLLSRCQACKVPNSMWSKIGRLKRSMMPKLGRGFMSGASPGVMACIGGRLLCDTHTCAGDLLKEVSYDLTELAKTQLNKDRKEINPHDVLRMFQSSETLVELIECGETDAWLAIELMFHLSILPLTRQLTNISGNLWGRTLQGSRAQRVEFLLLHAFHAKKYMVPDKYSNAKETKLSKRKASRGSEDGNDGLDIGDAILYNDASENDHGKGKKVPGYAGGLVLEPKKGLYDKYILLLDFNSLYPSIIQEYNICFTTVERSSDGTIPRLPSSRTVGVLPELLRDLVQRRKKVKSWMKNASGIKMQQFDIQQQALKLTANSMYGCLGFNNSRFYAKPLAELITLQGREILQSTVDLVQNYLNLEVIYGDTDSIMIYTGLDDIAKAKAMAGKVIQEVNKKYKCLEIDLDGLYKRMLILKKKKYASVKEQFRDGKPYQIIECKGLDIVRRDWCLLSKEQGDFCLNQILSGGSCDDVVESIHSSLRKVKEEITNGQVPLEKYIITKKLSKPPEDYPDAKSQPHVIVAQRMKKNGYTSGCSVGDTIPYIICCEQGSSSGGSAGIAQRARHPDELKRGEGKWMIDTIYYLEQQIHPVVSRLCAFIPGTSSDRLADCLGLDSSKFLQKVNEATGSNTSTVLLSTFSSDDERYKCCEPLFFSCPSCSSTFDCPPIFSSLLALVNDKQTSPQTDESSCDFWQKLRCPKCPEEGNLGRLSPEMIANQVKRQAEKFILLYYRGLLVCDDETCKHTTRSLNLRVLGDAKGTVCPNYPRCNGRLLRKYTEANLYKQLMYFCHILDTVRCVEKVEAPHRLALEKELIKIRPMVEQAASTVQRIRDRCAYGWVKLQDLIIAV